MLRAKPRIIIAAYLTIGLANVIYAWSVPSSTTSTPDFIAISVADVLLWPVKLATVVAPGLCAYWHLFCP